MDHQLQVKYKIWLDSGGKAFGEGPRDLLLYVQKTGSLRQAARHMNMSYSMAHKMINLLEERLGFTLILRAVGGAGGGGSTLTPEALQLLDTYDGFMAEAQNAIDRLFQKHFPETKTTSDPS